jgi:hypothetical protein
MDDLELVKSLGHNKVGIIALFNGAYVRWESHSVAMHTLKMNSTHIRAVQLKSMLVHIRSNE